VNRCMKAQLPAITVRSSSPTMVDIPYHRRLHGYLETTRSWSARHDLQPLVIEHFRSQLQSSLQPSRQLKTFLFRQFVFIFCIILACCLTYFAIAVELTFMSHCEDKKLGVMWAAVKTFYGVNFWATLRSLHAQVGVSSLKMSGTIRRCIKL
jgi:hypothetical protein